MRGAVLGYAGGFRPATSPEFAAYKKTSFSPPIKRVTIQTKFADVEWTMNASLTSLGIGWALRQVRISM